MKHATEYAPTKSNRAHSLGNDRGRSKLASMLTSTCRPAATLTAIIVGLPFSGMADDEKIQRPSDHLSMLSKTRVPVSQHRPFRALQISIRLPPLLGKASANTDVTISPFDTDYSRWIDWWGKGSLHSPSGTRRESRR